jgi:hypothetical protein
MPWLAVYVASRYEGLVVINEKRRDPHPSVAVPFLIPGLVLALRAIRDMNPLGWERPLLLAIVVSAILIFAACLADQALRKQRFAVGLIFLLSLGYGYGAAMETNAAFDRSASTVCASKVRRKYVNSGRSTSYHLVLAPWGPKETEDNVMVSRAFYDTQQVGDPVCISLRKGALGIAWYAVGYCQ